MGEKGKEAATSKETQQPSTSNTQLIDREQSMEISSYVRLADKENDIKDIFKEIKMRNERLKAQTYAQYVKLTPPKQIRLMLTFDIKEGKTQVSFLQPTVQQPKTSADDKKTNFEVLARDVHPIDWI